jgi:large subunit ribosomal protein L25
MTRKIEIEVPVKLAGVPTGVANEGGILEHVMRALTVQCLPGDLIEEVELDVTDLRVGKILRVRDVRIDAAKYKVLDDPDQVVAAVAAPRTEEEEKATTEADAATAAAGPEVLTEKKEEEGEEGAKAPGKDAKAPAKEEKKEKK